MTHAHAATPLGDYSGLNRDGVFVFKGINYALADRFQPSELETSTWSDLRDATVYGPQCLQVPGIMEQLLGESTQPMAEECLTLNVFTADTSARKPVLVWIHGGAFTNGAGSVPWYDGSNLVRSGDIVVVTINYRLGALGFRGRDNAGLSDQVNALQWVRNNIASFGGDPSQVTIMGESAGGASVISLMACPHADGLYSGAIAMSPSIPQLRSSERGDEALSELLAAAGVDHPDDLISRGSPGVRAC
jgi:para-nitrobenzyl esterase